MARKLVNLSKAKIILSRKTAAYGRRHQWRAQGGIIGVKTLLSDQENCIINSIFNI